MYLRSKSSKPQEPHTHFANSYGQYHSTKVYIGKKVIKPISSEVKIRAVAAAYEPVKMNAQPKKRLTLSHTNRAKHLISGAVAMRNSQIKVELLSSNLDDKIRRQKKTFAFIAKVSLWGVIIYVLVLSRIPEILMIFSR